MNLRLYLNKRDRKTADALYMKVDERLFNGQYRCRRITDNFTVVASKANPNDEFVRGTWVVVNYLGSSRQTIGGSYVIVSRAPNEQKGASLNPITEDDDGLENVTVSGFDPEPLKLVRGGDPGEIEIYGTGFLTGPSDYDTGIDNDVAPVVTPTKLTLVLTADVTSELGPHDIVVATGAKAKGAINVVEPDEEASMIDGVWAADYYNDGKIYRLELKAGDTAFGPVYDWPSGEWVDAAGGIYVPENETMVFRVWGENFEDGLLIIDQDLLPTLVTGIIPGMIGIGSNLIKIGGKLWYPGVDGDTLVSINFDGTGGVDNVVTGASPGEITNLLADSDGLNIWGTSNNVPGKIWKYEIATGNTDSAVEDAWRSSLTQDSTHVYFGSRNVADNGKLSKVAKVDMSVSHDVLSNSGGRQVESAIVDGIHVWVTYNEGDRDVQRYVRATMTFVDETQFYTSGEGPNGDFGFIFGMAIRGTDLLVLGSEGISVIDKTALTSVETYGFDDPGYATPQLIIVS